MVVSLMIVWPCMLRVGDEWSSLGSEECEFKFEEISFVASIISCWRAILRFDSPIGVYIRSGRGGGSRRTYVSRHFASFGQASRCARRFNLGSSIQHGRSVT
jgi:hypothetical protein